MIFHIFICILQLLRVYYELTKWPAPRWLDSLVGRALHSKVITWLCNCATRFRSKTHIQPLLAQWLEHLARSRRVMTLNPICNSDFFFWVDVISTFNEQFVFLPKFLRANFLVYENAKTAVSKRIFQLLHVGTRQFPGAMDNCSSTFLVLSSSRFLGRREELKKP